MKLLFLLLSFSLLAHPKYEYEGLLNAYYSKKSDVYFASKSSANRDVIAFQPFIASNFNGGFLWDFGYMAKDFKYSSRIVNLTQTTVAKEFPVTISVPMQLNLFLPEVQGLVLLSLPQEVSGQYVAPNLEMLCQSPGSKDFVNVSDQVPFVGAIDRVLVNEEVGIHGLGNQNRSLSFVGREKDTSIKQGYFNLDRLPKNSICKAYITYYRFLGNTACNRLDQSKSFCTFTEVMKFNTSKLKY